MSAAPTTPPSLGDILGLALVGTDAKPSPDDLALDAFLTASAHHLGVAFDDVEDAFYTVVPGNLRGTIDSAQGWVTVAEAMASWLGVIAPRLPITIH